MNPEVLTGRSISLTEQGCQTVFARWPESLLWEQVLRRNNPVSLPFPTWSTFPDPSFGLSYSWSLCELFSTIPLLSSQAHGRLTLSCLLWSWMWPCDLSWPMKCEQKQSVSHPGRRFKSQCWGHCRTKDRYGVTRMRRAPCWPMQRKHRRWAITIRCVSPWDWCHFWFLWDSLTYPDGT